MKTKYIIIGLAILLVILFFVQNKEHAGSTTSKTQNLSNEAIQNIAKIYADTIQTASFNNLNVTGKFSLLPTGIIVAFNSTNAPKGWAICDGQKYKLDGTGIAILDSNGVQTPDLRSKFIIGAGQGKNASGINLTEREFAENGGEENVALTLKEMPSHNHEMDIWGDPNGEPKTPGKSTLKFTDRQYHNLKTVDNRGARDTNPGVPPIRILYSGGDNSITNVPGFSTDKPETWGTKGHNNIPPYYALTYIMKL